MRKESTFNKRKKWKNMKQALQSIRIQRRMPPSRNPSNRRPLRAPAPDLATRQGLCKAGPLVDGGQATLTQTNQIEMNTE